MWKKKVCHPPVYIFLHLSSLIKRCLVRTLVVTFLFRIKQNDLGKHSHNLDFMYCLSKLLLNPVNVIMNIILSINRFVSAVST